MNESENSLFFTSRRSIAGWSLFWILVAIGLGIAISQKQEGSTPVLWVTLLLPLALAFTTYTFVPAQVSGVVGKTGLSFSEPLIELSWSEIQGVSIRGRKPKKPTSKNFAILIHHAAGSILIPAKLSIASEELLKTIGSHLKISTKEPVNTVLGEYHRLHVETFGSDRVFVFNALAQRRDEWKRSRNLRRLARALLLVGLILVVLGFGLGADNTDPGVALIFGVWALFFCFIFFVGSFASSSSAGRKPFRNASLVLTPVGLALAQADVQGELNWNQLLELKDSVPKGSFRLTSQSGTALFLCVEGVQIPILDVYDFPLVAIQDRIIRFWRPDFQNSAFGAAAGHFDSHA